MALKGVSWSALCALGLLLPGVETPARSVSLRDVPLQETPPTVTWKIESPFEALSPLNFNLVHLPHGQHRNVRKGTEGRFETIVQAPGPYLLIALWRMSEAEWGLVCRRFDLDPREPLDLGTLSPSLENNLSLKIFDPFGNSQALPETVKIHGSLHGEGSVIWTLPKMSLPTNQVNHLHGASRSIFTFHADIPQFSGDGRFRLRRPDMVLAQPPRAEPLEIHVPATPVEEVRVFLPDPLPGPVENSLFLVAFDVAAHAVEFHDRWYSRDFGRPYVLRAAPGNYEIWAYLPGWEEPRDYPMGMARVHVQAGRPAVARLAFHPGAQVRGEINSKDRYAVRESFFLNLPEKYNQSLGSAVFMTFVEAGQKFHFPCLPANIRFYFQDMRDIVTTGAWGSVVEAIYDPKSPDPHLPPVPK